MALPTLSPASTTNNNILPSTGTLGNVSGSMPFGVYEANSFFQSGAVDQVAFTFKKLGGDVLDVELTEGNVYTAYEEACLEYSYIVNVHQAKNSLSSFLGHTTASFTHDGQVVAGNDLENLNIELRYPKYDHGHIRRVSDHAITEAGLGGTKNIYSGAFTTVLDQQDYDLQTIISESAATDTAQEYYGKVGKKRIIIRRVFYKTPNAMWRFYGYYGGFSAVGNLRTYGQYADDSTFDIVPVWQNKLQSMAYEDAINTRVSHWSYEIKNNNIRIYPNPKDGAPTRFWVYFTVDEDPWQETESGVDTGILGINNMNTLPFQNIDYNSVNSIGKQWIRRFALALSKEILGQIRGKFNTVPIPGESVTLNHAELLSQAKAEQDALRDELKTTFDELTYVNLTTKDSEMSDNADKLLADIPAGIFVG